MPGFKPKTGLLTISRVCITKCCGRQLCGRVLLEYAFPAMHALMVNAHEYSGEQVCKESNERWAIRRKVRSKPLSAGTRNCRGHELVNNDVNAQFPIPRILSRPPPCVGRCRRRPCIQKTGPPPLCFLFVLLTARDDRPLLMWSLALSRPSVSCGQGTQILGNFREFLLRRSINPSICAVQARRGR